MPPKSFRSHQFASLRSWFPSDREIFHSSTLIRHNLLLYKHTYWQYHCAQLHTYWQHLYMIVYLIFDKFISAPVIFSKRHLRFMFFLTIPIHPLCYNNLRLRFLNIFILRYVVCFPHRIAQTACRRVYLGFKDLSSVAAPRFCSLPWNLAAR